MAVVMRLVSLILIVTALMLLGADAVTSLERGGDLTVRSLGTIWGLINPASLNAAKSWVQNHAAFMAQGVYSSLALPGWAVTIRIRLIRRITTAMGRTDSPPHPSATSTRRTAG